MAARARRRVSALRRHFPAPVSRAVLSRLGGRASDRPARPAGRGPLPRLYRRDDRHRHARRFATPIPSPISPSCNSPGCSRRGSRAPRGCAACSPSLFEREVEIDEFVGSLARPSTRRAHALGAANSRLGHDCIVGASMYSVSDKFRIRVFVRGHRAFPSSSCPARRARPANRRRGLSLYRRGIRLGHGARDSRRPDHAGRARPRRAARLDELDVAQLGEDRRDDPHATRASTW